jgi:hypothetical protein
VEKQFMRRKPIITIKKKEEVIILVVPTNVAKLVANVIVQPVKLARVPLQYPCIICYSVKHHILDCLKKIENQSMFCIMTNFVAIVVPKDFKLDNVPVNVIVIITTCNQVPEQYALN